MIKNKKLLDKIITGAIEIFNSNPINTPETHAINAAQTASIKVDFKLFAINKAVAPGKTNKPINMTAPTLSKLRTACRLSNNNNKMRHVETLNPNIVVKESLNNQLFQKPRPLKTKIITTIFKGNN